MRVLVTGGARSGKSRVAEWQLRGRADVTYVATGYDAASDHEWTERIDRHRSLRPAVWATVETLDVAQLLAVGGGPLLVDCLTLWVTRVMDALDCWDDDEWQRQGEQALRTRSTELLRALRDTDRDVVLVTNEVGQDVVPATSSGRRFRDELGGLNAAVAAECDDVLLCVAGRPLRVPVVDRLRPRLDNRDGATDE